MGGIVDMFTGGDDDVQKDQKDASKRSADAIIKASKISAASKTEALDYLKEREEVPQRFREGAMTELAGLAGLEGGTGNQQELIDRAISSPLYQSIMSGGKFGEEAIMRNAGMTGGLRSGNVQGNMYDYNTRLQNRALLESYNQQIQGLTGLAGLPSNVNQIAQTTADVGNIRGQGVAVAGQTRAQGDIAALQSQQAGAQNSIGNLFGLADLGMSAYEMFSDRRIKTNIKLIGKINNFNFYSFKWNSIGKALGLTGKTCGCMADEVFQIDPGAVTLKNGFMLVNYTRIGVL